MWKKTADEFPDALDDAALQSNFPIGVREQAAIGASISIKGDLNGEEDLVVQGQVEGAIYLKQYSLTVGKNGRIQADIHAKVIQVEGEVNGNLFAEEQIVIRKSGLVRGNISAPKVALEDGCRFKGSVDMEIIAAKKETQSAAPKDVKLPVFSGKEKAKSEPAKNKVKPQV